MTRVTAEALKLIQSFESLHDGDDDTPELEPKLCPADIVTYGWGRAAVDPATGKTLKGEEGLDRAMEVWGAIDRDTADQWFAEDITKFARGITDLVTKPLNPNQFGACLSLAYNIGLRGFRTSTVLRLLNKGDYMGASRAFAMWNKATIKGKKIVLAGLVRRRAAETALFLKDYVDQRTIPVVPKARPVIEAEEMPETDLDRAEKPVGGDDHSLVTSRTAIGGTVAAVATAANEVLPEIAETIRPLAPYVDWAGHVLVALAIAGGLLAVYARLSDRKKGKS